MKKKRIIITYFFVTIIIISFLGIYTYEYLEHSGDDYEDIITNFDITSPIKLAEELTANKSFIVFFGSKDCSPCKEYAPVLLKASQQHKESNIVKYFTLDKKEFLNVAQNEYGVMTTPTTLVVKNGKIIDRFENSLSENEILSIYEKLYEFKE